MKLLVTFLCLLSAVPSVAMDLPEYLAEVARRHQGVAGLRAAEEASEARRLAGDLELVPVFKLQGTYLSDKKQPNMLGGDEAQTSLVSADLMKKFATGTTVDLNARTGGYRQIGPNISPLFAQYANYGQGGLGISISQSLWRDLYGAGTALRRERQSETALAEAAADDLQIRQTIVEAESTFWDYLAGLQEIKIRQDSLDRAKRLRDWMGRRVSDGISDRADQLSADSLVATRELQILSAKDDQVAFEKKLRDYLNLDPRAPLPVLNSDLSVLRPPPKLIGADGSSKIRRLDAWATFMQARAAEVSARETAENLSSDLTLTGAYNTNTYVPNGGLNESMQDWTKTNQGTTQFNLAWTYQFDTSVKQAVLGAARKQALSLKLQAEQKDREADTAWSELQRRHAEMTLRINSTARLRKVQAERSKALQAKFSRGRAITTDVVTSEQDAAEADFQWTLLQREQRKLEAQARLFMVVKE